MKEFYVTLGGVTFPCAVRYDRAAEMFPPPDPAAPLADSEPVRIPDADWAGYLASGMADAPHTEFSMLTPYFSDALLARDGMILHAVALRWRDKAYLITAPSGVGKSTQARNLRTLCPGQFGVICGDRPVLLRRPEGILVCPSHWNGKEDWHGAQAAPLGGVVVLERGAANAIAPLRPRLAVLPVFSAIIQTFWKEDLVRRSGALEEAMLESVPLWHMTTHTIPDSTRLLLESVFPGALAQAGTPAERREAR